MIWDGVSDPWIAIVIDKLRKRFSTVNIYFAIGIPITSIATLCFFNTHHIPQESSLIFAIVVLILFRTGYTIIDVPHNSLISFITNNDIRRTNIIALRIFFSSAGRFLVTILTIDFMELDELLIRQNNFTELSYTLTLTFVAALLLCFLGIRKIPIVHKKEALTEFKLFELIRFVFSNKALLIVFAITAVTSATTNVIGSGFVYFAKYGLHEESSGNYALILFALSQASFLYFWTVVTKKYWGIRRSCIVANLVFCLTLMTGLGGIFDEYHLYSIAILAGICLGGICIFNWALLPIAIENVVLIKERRYDMSIFGFYTFINKVFHGFSLAYVGWVLHFFEYTPDTETIAINSITSLIFLLPISGAVACVLMLLTLSAVVSRFGDEL